MAPTPVFPQGRGSDGGKTGLGASFAHPERVAGVMFKKIDDFAILVHFGSFLILFAFTQNTAKTCATRLTRHFDEVITQKV